MMYSRNFLSANDSEYPINREMLAAGPNQRSYSTHPHRFHMLDEHKPAQSCPLIQVARGLVVSRRGVGTLSGEGNCGHLMRLDGWQYLLAKPFHVPHK